MKYYAALRHANSGAHSFSWNLKLQLQSFGPKLGAGVLKLGCLEFQTQSSRAEIKEIGVVKGVSRNSTLF